MKKKLLLFAAPVALVAVLWGAHAAYSFAGHRHHEGMFKDFMLYRLEKMTKDLNLNASQQAKMDVLKKDLESMIDQRMEKRRSVHQAIRDELSTPNPDITKITPLIDRQIDDTAAAAHDVVNKFSDFFQTLTPEQKKKMSDKFLERMHDRESHE